MKVNKDVKFNYGLSEAYRTGLRYAILDSEGNIRNVPFRCKDYMQDVYWSEILKLGNIKQYGFEWDGNNDSPVSKQKRVNLVLIPDEFNIDLSKHINNLSNFINIIEKELNLPLTSIEISESDNKDLIVNYDNEWSKRPYLVSLYLSLLRIGLFFEGTTIKDVINYLEDKSEIKNKWLSNDRQQFQSILKQKKLDILFIDKILPDQEWKDYTTSSAVHNSSGIMNYQFKIEKECQT